MLNTWIKIGIASGLLACLVYPVLILASLPRIPQVILGASFGPALVVASVALRHVLESRRRTASLELAADQQHPGWGNGDCGDHGPAGDQLFDGAGG